ncbi:FAD-binding domain-containing protein [Basidiobolus meristosporus CBS 931.73]|uniref:FAD-binding domain-containing protein n=1 Tax=Basidiobolus meristosporus CBS 931.73 TaxID=1314790 RepID=A0A1Y1YBQ2_9FUNG|nr:FAD-binding domain-containing protein [Basidiobolus meristosporus CBS 931.73]|eukprot:ORX95345.1 FAD-binding domain-containing protein [Basidiobolus meristosporus CBS 931.73]
MRRELLFLIGVLASTAFSVDERLPVESTASFPHRCPSTDIPQRFLRILSNSVSPKTAIVFPGSNGYVNALHHWSETAQVQSAAIVQPANSKDLSNIIALASSYNIDFAVASGGHNNDGASSTKGLLIDLSRFNEVRVSSNKKEVTVGAGLRWGKVYDRIAPYNISLVGGRVSTVGVGGFTLGGGYGWKTGKYGLAADTIIRAEMVLANGRIVTVSSTENPDLYFAIRGGGGQFGVVTKFVFRALPQKNPVFSGFYFYSKDQVQAVAKTMEKWVATNKDEKANLMLIFAKPPPSFDPVPVVLVWYDGPASIAKPAFKAFQDLKPTSDDTAEMSFAVSNTLQDPLVTDGDRKTMASIAWKTITREKILKAYDFYVDFTTKVPSAAQSSVLIEPVFSNAFKGIRYGESAYPHTKPLHVIGLVPRWLSSKEDAIVKRWVSKGTALLRAQERPNIVYPNYSGYYEPLSNMFGANLARLNSLKARYDRDCVFRHGFVFQTQRCRRCPAPASW